MVWLVVCMRWWYRRCNGVNRLCGSSRMCCGKHKATCVQCAWQCWQKSGIKQRDLILHTPLPMYGSACTRYESQHYLLVNLLCLRNMPPRSSDHTVTGMAYFQVLETLPVLQCLWWFSGCDELWNQHPTHHTTHPLPTPTQTATQTHRNHIVYAWLTHGDHFVYALLTHRDHCVRITNTWRPLCVRYTNTWRPLCVCVTDWILCFLEGSLNFFISFVSWVIGGGARHFGRLKAGEKKVAFS